MKSIALIGKKLEAILAYPSGEIHAAWLSDSTPPINTTAVFLRFSDSSLVSISPCEVELSEARYPSLGLALETCVSMSYKQPDGRVVEAALVAELSEVLPQVIIQIEESDPLEEGAISQYAIKFGSGGSILVQHIMPPMTLGVSLLGAD